LAEVIEFDTEVGILSQSIDVKNDEESVDVSYLIFDTSGSTTRGSWISACNQAMPHVVQFLEQLVRNGHDRYLCVMSYNDVGHIRVPLNDVRLITQLPELSASGLTSLAAAFRLLAEVLSEDLVQLEADSMCFRRPVVVVVADGLPTDYGPTVRRNAELLKSTAACVPCLHVLNTSEIDTMAFKEMGFQRVVPTHVSDTPVQLAQLIVDALNCDQDCVTTI